MDYSFNETLLQELGLDGLSAEEQEKVLFSLAQAINTQFLVDVHTALGEEPFQALQQSLTMGETFYHTTLKHLLPNHEDVFKVAREKILRAYTQASRA